MSRILIVGTGPLLESGARIMSGQCLRTWHFCKPLLDAGHAVRLMTIPIPGTTNDGAGAASEAARYEDLDYRKFNTNDSARVLPELESAIREFAPDAMIGVNAYPAFLLAKASLQNQIPLWADLNGWTMAEGLILGKVVGHQRDYPHFWCMEAQAALRADRFSTVTSRQAHALLGELAVLGRGIVEPSRIVATVPNAVYPDYASLTRKPGVPEFLREKLPPDSLIALWTGGFNSWTDLSMLVSGVKAAMDAESRLAFVCTGGAVHGHDEQTYKTFLALAKELPPGRFLPLGWIDFDQVRALHESANVGINLDGDNIETIFGARNRVTNLLGAGVPVVTTRGTEIAQWIADHEAGTVIPQGASGQLTAALVDSVGNATFWQQRAATMRAKALHDFAAVNTLPLLLEWCSDPKRLQVADDQPVTNLRALFQAIVLRPELLNAPVAPSIVPAADEVNASPAEKLRRLLKGIVRD
ncbi:hypothetical protein IT570_11290 [Candidatus Sumerlaeota bacterium]|nr:hypothetical protein [Candidatus Sumerlaeota bacterium]